MSDEDVIFEVPFNKALETSPASVESPQSRNRRYDMVSPDTPLEAMFRTYKKRAEHTGPVVKKSDSKDSVNTEVQVHVNIQHKQSGESNDENADGQLQQMELDIDSQTEMKRKVKEERINICVRPSANQIKKETEEDYAICVVCENRFTTVDSVLTHLKEVHADIKHIDDTMEEVTSANEMTLCFICGNQIRYFMLKTHLKEVHGKEMVLQDFGADVEKEGKSPTRQSSRIAGRQTKKDSCRH